MIDNVLFNVENIIILSKSVNHLHGMDLHIPFLIDVGTFLMDPHIDTYLGSAILSEWYEVNYYILNDKIYEIKNIPTLMF